jgi:hypothetical protein
MQNLQVINANSNKKLNLIPTSNSVRGNVNYGERLYQKGMRRKEEMAKQIEQL